MADMTWKKKRMNKKDYEEQLRRHEERLQTAASDPMRLKYHLQSPMEIGRAHV